MPIVAAVFPGQGAERPGVGLDWLDDPLFSVASRACAVDASHALRRFSTDLARTAVLQPLLLALALTAWTRLVRRGVQFAFVAGHSVGEIGAWAATGGVSFADAITLGAARGRAMEREATQRPGAMLALSADVDVGQVLAHAGATCVVAACNGPKQNVISGDVVAILRAEQRFGGRRLAVAGAWHSPLVDGAKDDLSRALARIASARAEGPRLITGLDGTLLAHGASPDLVAQVTAPVAWDRVMATLERVGVTDVVALAPGRTGRALLRGALGERVRIHVADSDRDLDVIARSVRGET
ncbi:ACP S-malonyltransferase [soil metagenome]